MLELGGPFEVLGPILGRIADVSPLLLGLALAFQLAKILAMSQVWRRILQAAFPRSSIRARDTVAPYLAGVGLNAVVPAKAGLLARAVLMRRALPAAGYETLAMTIMVEFLIGFAPAIGLVVVAIGMGILPGPAGWTGLLPGAVPHALAVALGLVAVLALLAPVVARRGRTRDRALAAGRRLRQGAAILGSGRALAQVLVAHGLVWALRLGCIWAFLGAFGVNATPRTVLLVVMVQMLSSLVPVAPNGVGAQQGLMVLALAGVASSGSILAFAVGMQASIAILDVVAGAAALALHGAPLRVLRELRSTARDPAPAPSA